MSSLTFHRIDSASELEALPKIDGQIIYTTYETPYNKWYIDVDKNNTGTVIREVIQGVDLGVMELTKSEYEAITDKDAHVMYFITDTEEIAYKDKIYNNYSLDAKTLMEQAQTSATNAKTSETNAKTSETNAKTSETNAKTSETNSANSATLSESWAIGGTSSRDGEDTNNSKYYSSQSSTYADNAKTSETNAKISETNAKTSESNAKTSETNAKTSEDNAKISETKAETSESNAATSETNAKVSETNASNSAKLSESWAVGGTSTRDGEDIDNSKYYAEQAKTSETNAKASETAAKEAADRASSITQIGIATTTTAGIVKPDGDTITVDINGVIKANNATTTTVGAVKPDNVTTTLDSSNSIVAQELQSVTQAQFDAITTKSDKIAYLIQSENDATSGTIYYNGRYYGNTSIQSMTKTEYDALDATVQNTHTYLITDD